MTSPSSTGGGPTEDNNNNNGGALSSRSNESVEMQEIINAKHRKLESLGNLSAIAA